LNAAFKMEEKSMMMIMNQRLDVVEIIKKGWKYKNYLLWVI
jgi:hypothetical protein